MSKRKKEEDLADLLEKADKARIEYERVAAAPAAPAPGEPNPELEAARDAYEGAMEQITKFLNSSEYDVPGYEQDLQHYEILWGYILDNFQKRNPEAYKAYLEYQRKLEYLRDINICYRDTLNQYERELLLQDIGALDATNDDLSALLNRAITALTVYEQAQNEIENIAKKAEKELELALKALRKKLNIALILGDQEFFSKHSETLNSDMNTRILEEALARFQKTHPRGYDIFVSLNDLKHKLLEAEREADAAGQEYLEALDLSRHYDVSEEGGGAEVPALPDADVVIEVLLPAAGAAAAAAEDL